MSSYTFDVFTPTKPARLTFVERSRVNDRIVTALRTPGKQIVVYGHSGSGKSTLVVNKLAQLYENVYTSHCMATTTLNELILNAFDQLAPFYQSRIEEKGTDKLSATLAGEYLGIKASIEGGGEASYGSVAERILPPQLTADRLADFLGAANACWVIEDFHKAAHAEKVKLAQVMKIFMDKADQHQSLKIVALGAVDTARQVVEYDAEMRNRVAEIHVPLMSNEELDEILHKGELLLNVKFTDTARQRTVHFSNGLAAICHQLCLYMCTESNINETCMELTELDDDTLQLALGLCVEEQSDTLKSAFDKAFHQQKKVTFNNGELIIRALAESPQEGALRADLFTRIRRWEPQYPQGNLTAFLRYLLTDEYGQLIRYDSNSGRYSFTDPLYRHMALVIFESRQANRPRRPATPPTWDDLMKMLRASLDQWAK